MTNPFDYSTPDAIPAQDLIDLFVPVFGEYYNVPNIGHTFVNGSRGSGKSMIFRYMMPDCQSLVHKKPINELDYFAINIPIKEGSLDRTDLGLIENKHGEMLLNEHLMVVNFAIKIFSRIGEVQFNPQKIEENNFETFYNDVFVVLLQYSGWKNVMPVLGKRTLPQVLELILTTLDQLNRDFTNNYLRKLIGVLSPMPYEGPICTFWEFLFPLIKKLREYSIFPDKPFFLLVDDADNLSLIQTQILNSWVSLRTTSDVCFKISTQLKYKTYRTVNNSRIDTPHDYSEVNISDIYTSKKGLYRNRVKEAVDRRLKKFGFKKTIAETFFPPDIVQEKAIDALFENYKANHGYDYAYRYSRPDFIKNLQGNRNTYSYAGFEQLVNISSGTMREFIEFARRMFVKQISTETKKVIKCISPAIQDEEIKDYSNWYLNENFSTLRDDNCNGSDESEKFDKLKNLVESLGQVFHLILISDASERRVFSFALQNEPERDLKEILDLGVRYGYFQSSTIGNKMGTGRTKLYILNRLLAPYYKLDPSSFAGYKFFTSDNLREAIYKPATFVRKIKTKGVDSFFENQQKTLFEE